MSRLSLLSNHTNAPLKGLAAAFAQAGAKAIIITARKVETLKETEALIKKINPSVEVLPVALEVVSESSVNAAYATIAKTYPVIDTLVHNAGVYNSSGQSLRAGDVAKWWDDIETNGKGSFLVGRGFYAQVPADKKDAHVIYMSSGAANWAFPEQSGYGISKLVQVRLAASGAAENPNVRVVAMHPGVVATDMATEPFMAYALDQPLLPGSFAVWLTSPAAAFLSGRFVWANWDVEEILARKDEIVQQNLLTMQLTGTLHGNIAEVR